MDAASCTRPAFPTSCERLPRPGPRPLTPGSDTTLDADTDVAPPPGGRLRRGLARVRKELAVKSIYYPAGVPEVTRMGRMPGQVLLAGGPAVDEDDLDEVVLWPPEEGADSSGGSEEKDGPDPPL